MLHFCKDLKRSRMRTSCHHDIIKKRLHLPEQSHVAIMLHFEGCIAVHACIGVGDTLAHCSSMTLVLSADARLICEGGLGEVSLLPRLDRERPTNCILAVRLLLHPGEQGFCF